MVDDLGFDDLDIDITANEPTNGPNVFVRFGIAKEPGTFSLRAVADDLARLNKMVDNGQPPDEESWKAAGGRLFTALLDRSPLYRQVTAPGRRVRLRLWLHTPDLLAVPWEYLYDPSPTRERALARRHEFSIVRSLSVVQEDKIVKVEESLRLLVMISTPSDLPGINSDAELANLQAVAALANIDLIPVDPTYKALQEALRQRPHVFHFIGHGIFGNPDPAYLAGDIRHLKPVDLPANDGANREQGCLAFRRADGKAELIPAHKLAELLADCSSLRLALLNTCQGATPGNGSAFAGVAQKLIQQGLPAVIAMQAPILDSDALAFSQEFYRALSNGYSLEAAVGEGRKRIAEHSTAWGVPALYFQGSEPFAIPVLTNTEKAERLWQRMPREADLAQRRQRLSQILALDPAHPAALAAQQGLGKEEKTADLYAAALAYMANEQWQDARRTLLQVDRLVHNYQATLSHLETVMNKLPPDLPPAPRAKIDQYELMLEKLLDGKLTPFLGSDASSLAQPAQQWLEGLYPPSAADAAKALAAEVALEAAATASLLQVSQYFELNRDVYKLYERLYSLYNGDFAPTPLHHLLARIPTRLAAKGYPRHTRWRYVLFSTAFDNLLERAFDAAGQPYHLFAYRPPFRDDLDTPQPALFVHRPPAGQDGAQGPFEVRKPNEYRGHDSDTQPIIVKLCGWQVTANPDSVAVTEDHYVEYIAADRAMTVLPTTLLSILKPNSFLFFGHSLQPWPFRFLWKRLGLRVDERQPRKWAIVPTLTPVEETFWQSQRIEPIVAQPEGVVAYVNDWLERL